MLKKVLSLILAGVILFSSGAIVFAKTSTNIYQLIKSTDSSTSQSATSSVDEVVPIDSTSTDAEEQTTNDVSEEDENKYISWKEADQVFKSEFDNNKNYHDLFHPYVTLGGLAYRIWLTAGSPVMDEGLNDFGNTWWYCAFNKIINEDILNNIVMKENRFYSLNELRITPSEFAQIIENYKNVCAMNSNDLRQASKPFSVKTFTKDDAIQIRTKYYSYDGVIDYTITCIIGQYCIVENPRLSENDASLRKPNLPSNGEILQDSHMPKNNYIVKINNYEDIEILLGDLYNDCLFFYNGNVYSSIDELLKEESVESSLNLLDVFYLYYGNTSETEATEIIIDYNDDSNQRDSYKNQSSINLLALTRNGYNFDGYNVCKEEIDENNNKIKFWHCTNDKDEYQWLTEETAEYKITKFNDNSTIFNIGDESISFVAQWKKCTDAEYFTYTKNEATKTVTITKYTGNDTEVVIPASIDEYSVTSIGDRAFRDSTSLINIILPNFVTSIGDWAFCYCASLASITIPNSVTSIGNYAFLNCTSLTNITIPDSVTTIGNHTFRGCESLTSVTVSNNLTNIGDDLFALCASLESITIPNSVTNIPNGMFRYCTSLTNINIPKSVKGIGVASFEGCESLISINIPDSVTSIDNSAFWVCTSLKNITIPYSVTSIGERVFMECTSLSKITVDSNNENYTSIDGVLFTKDMKTLLRYPCNKKDSVYTIPDSIVSLDTYSFESCTNLTNINIPNRVASIGNCAFNNCISLMSIAIPDSVISIGNSVFMGCSSLTSIEVDSNNENYISVDGALLTKDMKTLLRYSCDDIDVEYTILSSVTSIDRYAFESCTGLTSIKVDSNNENYTSVDGVLFTKDIKRLLRYPCCKEGVKYTIPNSVVMIDACAFESCTSLTNIIIPNSITYINYHAFFDCRSLKSVSLPNSLKTIANYAFSKCSNLTSVIMPDSVTYMGYRVFYNCDNLIIYCNYDSYTETYAIENNIKYKCYTSASDFEIKKDGATKTAIITKYIGTDTEVVIPASIDEYSVTSIGDCALSDCIRIKSVDMPNSVTKISDYAFYGCINLTSITIPESVTRIGHYAFSYCESLTSITIPDSVTSIGEAEFLNCTSLSNIIISKNVKIIDEFTFFNCTSLKNVIIPDGVIYIDQSVFVNCRSLSSVTIGKSLKSIITDNTFSTCTSLKGIYIDDNNDYYTSVDGVLFTKDMKTIVVYPCGKTDEEYIIPRSVTSMDYYAFSGCTSLVSVDIPDNISSIIGGAFLNCKNLTSITIPNSVTSIGYHAFSNCTSLKSINIPDSVSNIDNNAFNNCKDLTIYCHSGSYAETYAKSNNIPYTLIS